MASDDYLPPGITPKGTESEKPLFTAALLNNNYLSIHLFQAKHAQQVRKHHSHSSHSYMKNRKT